MLARYDVRLPPTAGTREFIDANAEWPTLQLPTCAPGLVHSRPNLLGSLLTPDSTWRPSRPGRAVPGGTEPVQLIQPTWVDSADHRAPSSGNPAPIRMKILVCGIDSNYISARDEREGAQQMRRKCSSCGSFGALSGHMKSASGFAPSDSVGGAGPADPCRSAGHLHARTYCGADSGTGRSHTEKNANRVLGAHLLGR